MPLRSSLLLGALSAASAVITVGVIGDSITCTRRASGSCNGVFCAKCNGPFRQLVHYPELLQMKLGTGYFVTNYGQAGTTAMNYHRAHVPLVDPWRLTPEHPAAVAASHDIVVLMLGTNDAIGPLWSEANYSRALLEIVAEFNATSKRTIVLVPPPVSQASATSDANLMRIINTRLPTLVPTLAREANVELASPYSAFMQCGGPDPGEALTCDGVHPTPAGQLHLAAVVAAAIDPERFGHSWSCEAVERAQNCPLVPALVGSSAGLGLLVLLCVWQLARRCRRRRRARTNLLPPEVMLSNHHGLSPSSSSSSTAPNAKAGDNSERWSGAASVSSWDSGRGGRTRAVSPM